MRLPGNTDRLAIVGATGSGKTHAALWHLSMKNYSTVPWVVYDFKGDELINEIEGARHMGMEEKLPEQAGLYVYHPNPSEEDDVQEHMWRIWKRENMGVYVDEGYMVGNNNKAFRALLTQGRSKHIPVIVLSQRPVWMDRFVLSESGFFQVFRLQHRMDTKKVEEFVPYSLQRRLPEYHSYYYDVGTNQMGVMKPTPDRDAILDTFDMKLSKLKKVV
jgi:DNA helicase HerA-like ATPase